MSPRFFLLCLLSLGVCHSGGVSSDKESFKRGLIGDDNRARFVYKVQISAIMDAYHNNDEIKLNHLMHASEVRVPIYYLPNVQVQVAKFQTDTEVRVYGTSDMELYLAKLDRNQSSPTGYYMSYMARCGPGDC